MSAAAGRSRIRFILTGSPWFAEISRTTDELVARAAALEAAEQDVLCCGRVCTPWRLSAFTVKGAHIRDVVAFSQPHVTDLTSAVGIDHSAIVGPEMIDMTAQKGQARDGGHAGVVIAAQLFEQAGRREPE